MASRITPFVKRMRTEGGTIFAFSSAVEDIGLNINERNNIVKMSHFALLNIPRIDEPDTSIENVFNIGAIAGALKNDQGSPSIKDGRVLIAESFQNYALNLEAELLNRTNYNPSLQKTVAERVFWKWLKETGAIRWDYDPSGYWVEELDADGSAGYNSVVKYVGLISAGNVRQDTFGTYNETYIQIPTSHGQTRVYFKQTEDENYLHNMQIPGTVNGTVRILGRSDYLQPHPDLLDFNAYYDFIDSSTLIQTDSGQDWYTYYDPSVGSLSKGWWYTYYGVEPSYQRQYLTDSSLYKTTGIYNTLLQYNKDDLGSNTITFQRSNVDCLELVFNLDTLKTLFADSALTYDRMAIDYAINDNFDFNVALLYYTVYNSTADVVLATNLLGVLFIDAPSGNSTDIGLGAGILIPSLEKLQSTINNFGTAFSLRLNIKTDNMVDDTQATIVDFATSDQLYEEDWAEVFANLSKAVNILSQNNATIQYISNQYTNFSDQISGFQNQIQFVENQVNSIGRNILGTENTLAMFAADNAEDSLIDSSIYMKYGNVGINTNNPLYQLHVAGDVKTEDIFIENAIRDTSGNVLLGYGSPIQIGASTNTRGTQIFAGSNTPILEISTGLVMITTDISVNGIVSAAEVLINGVPVSGITDISVGLLEASVIYNTAQIELHEIRLDAYEASIIIHDASLTQLRTYTYAQDSSITALTTNFWNALSRTDNSVYFGGPLVRDTSITMNNRSVSFRGVTGNEGFYLGGISNIGENATEIIKDFKSFTNVFDLKVDSSFNIHYETGGELVSGIRTGSDINSLLISDTRSVDVSGNFKTIGSYTHVQGELHQGTPANPKLSIFGSGHFHLNQILVYTYDGSVFTDVTAEADDDASTFSFVDVSVGNAIYVASSISNGSDYLTFAGIKATIDSSVLGGNIITEIWNGSQWQEINTMVTDASDPYRPYAKNLFQQTGTTQIRLDQFAIEQGTWTKSDEPAVGTDLYWLRFRVDSELSTKPVLRRFALHSNSLYINHDGFVEYFGLARTREQLHFTSSNLTELEGVMGDQNLWVSQYIGAGYTNNTFNSTDDIVGFSTLLPIKTDTSNPLEFNWAGITDTNQTIGWTIRWAYLTPDSSYYTTDPGAIIAAADSSTVYKSINNTQRSSFQMFLDISEMIPRRSVGEDGDEIWISVQCSSLAGNYYLATSTINYIKWCDGGHIHFYI